MVCKDIKSKKKCKDCGKPAHSWQIGWEDPETKDIHWHPPKHYNHCKKCRSEKAKRGPAKRREIRETLSHGNQTKGGKSND